MSTETETTYGQLYGHEVKPLPARLWRKYHQRQVLFTESLGTGNSVVIKPRPDDHDRIFHSEVHGRHGVVPREHRVWLDAGSHAIIAAGYLADLDPSWLAAVYAVPSDAELHRAGLFDGRGRGKRKAPVTDSEALHPLITGLQARLAEVEVGGERR